MSTRTRVLLKFPAGKVSTGARAVKELLIIVYKFDSSMALRKRLKEMTGLSKIEKLRSVAEKLPPRYSLTFIQEPRGTRRNRSLYWQQQQRER